VIQSVHVGASLEDVFRTEYVRLVRALAVYAGDVEAASDAVQDAFVQAHRHWGRVSGYADPALWIRRVAINRVSNQRRGRSRRERALARVVRTQAVEVTAVERGVLLVYVTPPSGPRVLRYG
jgi:RNA polymerase sigma-70 factor (ECF subfamily)